LHSTSVLIPVGWPPPGSLPYLSDLDGASPGNCFVIFRSSGRPPSWLTVVVTLRPRDASGASRLRVSGANDPAGWPPRREIPRGLTGLDFTRREIVLQFFVCRAGGPPSSRVRSWSSSVGRVF